MKEYQKPEVELVEFSSEEVANTGVTSGVDDGNIG